jgi:electron transfer flavoprotein alpha subunit
MSVLVVLEQTGGKWNRMSWETLVAGQQLAAEMGTELHAAVPGSGIGALATEAATKKCARVYAVEHDLLKDYTADAFTAAVEALVKEVKPTLVLFPHT